MADNTKIEWADATANYLNGCSVLSKGCTNCYAMKLAGGRLKNLPSRAGLTKPSKAGPVWTGETRADEKVLRQVLSWKRPRKIFWNAHGDLFHESVSDETIDRQFAVMALTPQHTHQVLTKRPERMRAYVTRLHDETPVETARRFVAVWPAGVKTPADGLTIPLPNVWLGTSVEDQASRVRLLDLAATPAAVRFMSGEPLLEGVSLTDIPLNGGPDENGIEWLFNALTGEQYFTGDDGLNYGGDGPEMAPLDWIIAGGESGNGARPMHPDWARELRDQCAAAGVAFLFKQWGGWAPCEIDADGQLNPVQDGRNMTRWRRWDGAEAREPRKGEPLASFLAPGVFAIPMAKHDAGRLLDGRTHDEFPASKESDNG